MFKSFKAAASESESAALSVSNIDGDENNASSNDKQSISKGNKSKKNKSVKLIKSLSSNIKEKLQKKKFHRLDIEDKGSDSQEIDDNDDVENHDNDNNIDQEQEILNNNNNNNNNDDDGSYSDLQHEDIEFTQINNKEMENSNDSLNDHHDNDDIDDVELSQLSNDDDGDGSALPHKQISRNKFENTYTFFMSLSSIFCHLMTMIFVSFTQIMVSSALYIIVPLHVRDTLKGGEILTGLIFMNYGFAYLSFTIFGSMCCTYYGSTFTILISIFIASLALLFMTIFTDYFVWLMMIFVEGISFAMFTVGSLNFVIDNISIKWRTDFENMISGMNKIAMVCGCIYAGHAIQDHSIVVAMGVTMGLSLSGIIFVCTLSIPPKYNDNCLVNNDSQQQQMEMKGNNEDRIITKASISAWKQSFKQINMKQRLSIFSWIKYKKKKTASNWSIANDVDIDDDKGDHTPTYGMEDELNTLQVFRKNISTLLSICIFSFGLTFMRCCRLLIITFKCMEIDELTASDIGYINGISFVPELFLYYIGYWILYKYGRRYTLFTSFLLFIIGLFVLPYCNDFTSLTYIAAIFGIGNGLSYGLIHKVAIDVAPTEYRDKFLTIYHTLTNFAYLVAPIFVALLIEGSSISTSCICSAVVLILSLIWSLCIMTDPKQTGKRYEQLDFDKSYGGNNNDEPSLYDNGYLINGKHIGPPIGNNIGNRYKMELHSIDSVMENESIAGNDAVETRKDIQENIKNKDMLQLFDNKSDSESNKEEKNKEEEEEDDYVERIANKEIGDINLGGQLNINVLGTGSGNIINSQSIKKNEYHRKFEIGHFDEEEEEESMHYQLSSTDED